MTVKPTLLVSKYFDSNIKGYVDKTKGTESFLEEIKQIYGLEKILKFDLGENPEGPSPTLIDELKKFIRNLSLISEYPDSSYLKLREELAKFYGVKLENITVGTGSNELIERISRLWIEQGTKVIFPIPSFYRIEDAILRFGGVSVYIQLKDEENYQWTENTTNELIRTAKETKSKLIWLVTPNNPAGGIIPLEEIQKIVEKNKDCIIIVDEAFGEYIDSYRKPYSAINLIKSGIGNILVTRTFSKIYGLAGLRLGYCVGSNELIKLLERIRMEFAVNAVAEKLAIAALKDQEYIEKIREKTSQRRKLLENSLDKIEGIKYYPSQTHIMLIKHKSKNLYNYLLKEGILVATMEISGLEGKNYIRITIRNEEENNILVNAIKKFFGI